MRRPLTIECCACGRKRHAKRGRWHCRVCGSKNTIVEGMFRVIYRSICLDLHRKLKLAEEV